MPQRGNNELHLYDRRSLTREGEEAADIPVHSFEGHENQVKEFLWRPRGAVTEGIDDREFQLVSWGTDKMLRLHRLDNGLLGKVGYVRGQEVRAHLNMTRRNAVYKTFQDDPARISSDRQGNVPLMQPRIPRGMRAGHPKGLNHGPLIGHRAFVMGVAGSTNANVSKTSQDMDPITWMKGVRIGKHVSSPSAIQRNISPILSPKLTASGVWDKYDSFGEEIAHVADKFSMVNFEEVAECASFLYNYWNS